MARHQDSTSAKRGGSYYVNSSKFHGSSEFANMPTSPTMQAYPKSNEADVGGMDDTMRGIDMAQKEMTRKTARHLSRHKV